MKECLPLYYVKLHFNNIWIYLTRPKNKPFRREMQFAVAEATCKSIKQVMYMCGLTHQQYLQYSSEQ